MRRDHRHTSADFFARCKAVFARWTRALATLLSILVLVAVWNIGIAPVFASGGQVIKLVTSDGGATFYVGRCFRTNILVQTDGLNANSVDVYLPYDPAYLVPYRDANCTTLSTNSNAIVTDGLFPS